MGLLLGKHAVHVHMLSDLMENHIQATVGQFSKNTI